MSNRNPTLPNEEYKGKKYDAKVARELGYSKKVVNMLLKEEDPVKRQRILADARHGKYGR